MMKRLIYLAVIFWCFVFQTGKHAVTRWVIINGCSMQVDGSTNINKFSCVIANYNKPDTILVQRTGNQQTVQLTGSLALDVGNFNCHNPIMTADLRKTLKSKQFPYLVIKLQSLTRYPDINTAHEITKGMVTIELAGVTKKYEVDYKIISADNAYINMIGTRKVLFSDFNISPPRKLGGMIRTKDELEVEFNLRMKVL